VQVYFQVKKVSEAKNDKIFIKPYAMTMVELDQWRIKYNKLMQESRHNPVS